ncbi:TPA: SAVED domain-containing protein [Pseudomonas aeruginosa]|nr:SAVED domain-containing protein [Pseudomonas aeruginosa]HEH9487693.1 SAVED domain-containing protein [Pseudomonas aeruginosa]
MSGILQWAMGLISAVVLWKIRKRNIGLVIFTASLGALGVLAVGDYSFEAKEVGGYAALLKFSTSGGLPDTLLAIAVYTVISSTLVGLYLVLHGYVRDNRDADSRRVPVVELRGLVDTSDSPLINAVPARIIGRREDLLFDLRSMLQPESLNVAGALDELAHLPRSLRRVRGDSQRGSVQVIAGGVLQVPLLFATGVLLDDEGQVLLMDWERVKGKWCELDEVDSGQRFIIEGLESESFGDEVVLAISASYKAELSDISKSFPGLQLVHMARPDPKVNKIWSEDEQVALTTQFIDTLCRLKNSDVKLIHLVLAAPASLAIRFGRHYDLRNMPLLRCYHWQKNENPAYAWGVEMPINAKTPGTYFKHSVMTAEEPAQEHI